MTGNSAMDDGSRCLLDVIGDPSALQSFLEEGESLKNSPSVSLDDSPLQVDFSIRTNGTHFRASPTLLKQAAAAAAAGNLGPFQVSSTQTISSGVSTQVVCSTQAPSPAYHQPVASPQIGQSPLGSHNATAAVQSPSSTPFSVPSRSPAPSPIHAPPPPCQSPASIYQSKSPVQAPSPLPHHAPPSKSPGAGVVLPQPSPSPTTPIASPQQAILQQPVAQTLSLAASASGPVVQFVSAAPTPIVSGGRNMKPIQPKQPHLLPKPSGATNGMQFGNAVGKQTNHRSHPVNVAPNPQTNQLVIGQNQASATMLPNANVAVAGGSGGALLFNHISLGLAQNHPFLIQGNAGLQNLQLVMRPQQQPGAQTTTQGAAGNTNAAALLAALQVQNQAARQALINQSKGQTMVIPTSTNLLVPQGNPLGKQNVIVNSTRMVNPGQGLQLQQVQIQTPQGPITLAITPQQLQGLQAVGGANLTLATGAPAGTVLQGVTLSQAQIQGTAGLQTGVVVNRQTIPATSLPASDNRPNSAPAQQQQQQQQQQVKAPGVNLEELLKQAGIVPADPRQTPLLTTQTQNVVVSQPQQTVLLNSTGLPVTRANNSQLLAQLQQSINLAQAPQAQMKLSFAQDGSVFLQRPVVTPAQASTGATGQETQQSVLMQRLNAGTATGHHQIQIPTTTSMESTLLPITVQNINLSTTPQTALLTIAAPPTTVTSGGGESGVVTTTMSGLIQANPTLVQSLTQGTAAQLNPSPAVAVSTTQTQQQQQQQQTNAILTQNLLNQLTTSYQATFGTTAVSLSNGAGMVKPEMTPVVFTTGSPITAIPPGQKLQTIQLTPQNQETYQKIQIQLRNLTALKTHTPQQRQLIQQLQASQQKILSQGKVVQIQQSPANTIQLIQQQPTNTVMSSVAATTKNNANVHLSNLLKQAPANARTISTPTTTTTTTTTTKTSTVTTTTVTMPTQIKVGNQVVTLTPQQRQTFHQLQQQLKTLGPEQQQVFLGQNKQAVIVKLQQQQQNQQQTSTTNNNINVSGVQPTTIAPAQPAIAVASNAGGLLVIQTFGKGIAQVKSIVPAIVQDQQSRGIKRPAPTPVAQGSPLQQQLALDQNGALKPDCRTPFRSVKDACRRLLKYHVFNSKTPTQQDFENADKQFEVLSEQLLQKARRVFSTYHHLLLQESMRKHPSAELLMLNKLFVEDEKTSLENDKKGVKEGKELNLPPLPEHWRHKMDAVSDETPPSTTTTSSSTSSTSTTSTSPPPPTSTVTAASSTLASTSATTVVTTVHTAPLSSPTLVEAKTRLVNKPNNANKSSDDKVDRNYDEWAEIQKELEMYPLDNNVASSSSSQNKLKNDDDVMMDGDWYDASSNPRLSESEAAVESILLDGTPTPLPTTTTDMDSFEDDEVTSESHVGVVQVAPSNDDLNAQVESAINSILHLQHDNEGGFEYMDGEYGLMDEEEGVLDEGGGGGREEEEGVGVDGKGKGDGEGVEEEDDNNSDHVTMEYEAVSLDTPEMDAALEEAVKSIM